MQKVVYYLITDSGDLEQDAKRLLGDRIVVTGLEQAHAEIHDNSTDEEESVRRATDGFMRTIAESWIFAGTSSPAECGPKSPKLTKSDLLRDGLPGTDSEQRLRQDTCVRDVISRSRLSIEVLITCAATWLRGRDNTTILDPRSNCSLPSSCVLVHHTCFHFQT